MVSSKKELKKELKKGSPIGGPERTDRRAGDIDHHLSRSNVHEQHHARKGGTKSGAPECLPAPTRLPTTVHEVARKAQKMRAPPTYI